MPRAAALRATATVTTVLLASLAAAPTHAQGQATPAPTPVLGTVSEEAQKHFDLGMTDLFNAFPQRGLRHLDQALEAEPSFALARAIRASATPGMPAADRQAEFDRAIADARGLPTVSVLNILAWRTTDPRERRVLLEAMRELRPDIAPFAHRLAQLETDPARRAAAFGKVVQEFPNFAAAYNMLAYSQWATGKHEEALRTVQEYVRRLPDHPNPYDSYGEMLQWAKRYDEALAQYQLAVSKDPEYAEGYAGIAEVRQLTGKHDEARAAWRQAIAHAPPNAKFGYAVQVAGSHVLSGDRKAALEELEAARRYAEAANQTVPAALAHAMMGVVEANAGNRAAVKAHLDAAAQRAPEAPALKAWSAIAYVLSGDLASARQIQTALAAQADTGNAAVKTMSRNVNAIVAAASGDIDRARSELGELTANSILAKAMLAEALRRAGRTAEAKALRDEVASDTEVSILASVARARARKI